MSYPVRTGWKWRHLPREFPPWQTVYYHYRRWADRGLLRLLLACDVSVADVSDQARAKRLLAGLRPLQPRLALVWGDGAYGGRPFATWADEHGVRAVL